MIRIKAITCETGDGEQDDDQHCDDLSSESLPKYARFKRCISGRRRGRRHKLDINCCSREFEPRERRLMPCEAFFRKRYAVVCSLPWEAAGSYRSCRNDHIDNHSHSGGQNNGCDCHDHVRIGLDLVRIEPTLFMLSIHHLSGVVVHHQFVLLLAHGLARSVWESVKLYSMNLWQEYWTPVRVFLGLDAE